LIAAGGECFDFTIGDEPFKMDFGTSPTAIHALTAQPTWRGQLMRAALETRQRLSALRQAAGKGKQKAAP
jgi:CelD/BcsL family acetyltransferase involved in cellulose biosynthesis